MIPVEAPMPRIPPGCPYPEVADPLPGKPDRMVAGAWSRVQGGPLRGWWRHGAGRLADAAMAAGTGAARLPEARFREEVAILRGRLVNDGLRPELVVRAFALTREATRRVLGLSHHRVQLLAGAAMLDRALAEMNTGEGKTITAMLPAVTFALAGRPVHVVTVNDYLAQRDAEHLTGVYEAMGLSVGIVTGAQTDEERREGYKADVAYCTNSTLVFDYLRDRLAIGRRRAQARRAIDTLAGPGSGGERTGQKLFLRGLHAAIVDEADSVLIDEARTPLILSGGDGTGQPDTVYAEALDLATRLQPGTDYEVDHGRRTLRLSEGGKARLTESAAGMGGLWRARRAREELALQALKARLFFIRGHQYAVIDGEVQIIDEFTGRVMPDRKWENGLHQMVEVKEGCALSDRRATIARITYQRFFTRYGHLCGMTGTAAEARAELAAVYGLAVKRVPTHQPSKRRDLGVILLPDAAAKWDRVAARAAAISAAGQAVLVGTRSVAASEHLADIMRERGLSPTVLNAQQSREEATIVARAGQAGAVTVATNMAGRGTDIRLSRAVREAGGLHVILTEYHESARIDRQLFGRCARQGDPGSAEAVVALDDEVFARFVGTARARAAMRAAPPALRRLLGRVLTRLAQFRAERLNASARRQTLAQDIRLETSLAFAGRGE